MAQPANGRLTEGVRVPAPSTGKPLWIVATCLGIAALAGWWRCRETTVVVAGPAVRFSTLHDLTWKSATGRLERTGGDPYGWVDLPATLGPVRRVTAEFTGAVDPVEGHFYFFRSTTTPPRLGLGMVEGRVTPIPGGLSVGADLADSLWLRIDLPDFLRQPLTLRRLVIERPFLDLESGAVLAIAGAALGAVVALGLWALGPCLRRRPTREIAWGIFALSAMLRIGLAVVNREANDNHVEISRIILEERRLPTTADAWEGFQPKLYHTAVAAIGAFLPCDSRPECLVLVGQALNCLAGLAGLGLAYRFLERLQVGRRTRLWCFALAAFNPKLIGIQAQATNDSFVILFGTIAICAAQGYLQTESGRDWWVMTVAVCLASLSKATGLILVTVLPGMMLADLGRRIWAGAAGAPGAAVRRLGMRLAAFATVFVILVPVPGQYVQRWRESGTLFATNIAPQPAPGWTARTYVMRPGIISFRDGFLTFPLRSLLEYPMITNHGAWQSDRILVPGQPEPAPSDPRAYPLHMVSFWTQLHGGIHSVHFDAWPPSWRSSRPLVVGIGRMLMLTGLVSSVLGLLGFAMTGVALLSRTGRSAQGAALLELSCVAAFLIFLACYAVRLRDFSAMKAVFLLPAGVGFLALLANGLEAVQRWIRTPVFHGMVAVGLGLLCLLYGMDTVSLIIQLGAPGTGN